MKNRWVIVLIIVVVASVFRLWQLDTIPPGLYPDEAMNGNNAIQTLETGEYKVFYPENNGREGLFVWLQAASLKAFGYNVWSLRVVSAIAGIMTVLGLYFLVKQLFNWQIAALSSYLMAISFWHILFSRIGFRAILAPMLLVWGIYFFWRGKVSGKLWTFAVSGIFWGLGFYTYIAFRAIPLALIFMLLAYWYAIRKDFAHGKYELTRNQVARGFALFMVVTILVALPIGIFYYQNPSDFLGRTAQISIASSDNPVGTLVKNVGTTLAMFNFVGDHNWRHNFAGSPLLMWPIGVLFALGFLRSLVKFFKRKHGHFSSVHTLLLSWFFVGLLPVILSNEGIPHALRAILVAPVVFIFAGEGLWWIIDKMGDWYRDRDVHEYSIRGKWLKESSFMAIFALVVILIAITFASYDKYFDQWAKNENVPGAFNQNYVDVGNQLNDMPQNIKKYVLVNTSGTLVNGIPMPAQTVMFITDTYTPEKQKAKNIFYLTEKQFENGEFTRGSVIIPLEK